MGFHHTLRGDCSSAEGVLLPLRLGAGIVIPVTFQKIDNAPCPQAGAQGDHKDFQGINRTCKKFHTQIKAGAALFYCNVFLAGPGRNAAPASPFLSFLRRLPVFLFLDGNKKSRPMLKIGNYKKHRAA